MASPIRLDLIYAFFFLPFYTVAQTYQNITLGSSLTAGGTISSWSSPSNDFAFGFHNKIEPTGTFLLAIWFNQVPEKTITWSANRDQPLPSGSKVELNTDKGLILTDPSGQEIWRAKFPDRGDGERLAYAAILDTGNFVLATKASATLWQSFDEPTDTLLPTQVLNPGGQLIARYKEHNYSGGRFSFKQTKSGNLSLFTTNFPLYTSINSDYWDYTNTMEGLGHQVVFNQSGFMYLIAKNGSILINMFFDEKSIENMFYQRVILDYDGSGVCGYNSYCKVGDDNKPHCICPPDYMLSDPNDEMGGCDPKFLQQSCDEASQKNHQFDMKVLQSVDWPLSDYERYQNVTIDWCRNMCLMDCLCAVAIYKENGDCWKKKLPLTNGKSDRSVERTAFIKGIRFIFDCKTLKQGIRDKIQETYTVPSFSYKELNDATDGFREELGRGAFGVVYKGVMGELSGPQTFIAVKKLDSLIQDAENIFKVEVNAIGQTHHKNLVRLVGYCVEGEHWLLVYEFMSNGTLCDFLCGTPRPAWEKRWPIAHGIAQGLLYLHEHCNTQIIHCDIKPQNILLDDDFSARISDFGLAKLLRLDQTQTNTAARGTRGYVAPEWFKKYANHDKSGCL
uniref:non-specific serine/threonine protein kinase n=1 Tax=Chenopodium quinoa TaxID=63459 RepID=A0A803LIS4_CHEQI